MRPVVASSTTPNGASTTGTDHIRLRGVAPTPSFVPSNLSTADVHHSSVGLDEKEKENEEKKERERERVIESEVIIDLKGM
ncbi:hypothetical protein B9Z55_002005 [Caenorhabditis nigoni]|uniref:Uncharacterized protein n=1 Tax=Caenorhabditis nigoni TaxID=1611254 RepID=A0A2G5VIG4_9PELO|nr:hypothetical protein B9Z55_002005 [Caenorhabditis nigoni]